MVQQPEDYFGEVISSYTRENAIEDGVLIDVTPLAKRAGFKYHTAITSGVHSVIDLGDALEEIKETYTGRFGKVLYSLLCAIKNGQAKEDIIFFNVNLTNRLGIIKNERFKSMVHAGDNHEPVMTILLPLED